MEKQISDINDSIISSLWVTLAQKISKFNVFDLSFFINLDYWFTLFYGSDHNIPPLTPMRKTAF